MREKIVTKPWRLLVCPLDALGHALLQDRGPRTIHLPQYSSRDPRFAPSVARPERNEGSARPAMSPLSCLQEVPRTPGRDIDPRCHRSQVLALPDPHFGRSGLQDISKPLHEQPLSLVRVLEVSQSCPFQLKRWRARLN